MMKYYKFEVYHNDSYLLEVSKVDRYKYITCSTCKMILDKRNLIEKHLPTYTIKRKKYHYPAVMMVLRYCRKNLRIYMRFQIGKGLYSIPYLKVKAFIW